MNRGWDKRWRNTEAREGRERRTLKQAKREEKREERLKTYREQLDRERNEELIRLREEVKMLSRIVFASQIA